MLKWEMIYSPLGEFSLTVSWDQQDVILLDLAPFDIAFLRECEASQSGADKLLAAEMLVRKMEVVT